MFAQEGRVTQLKVMLEDLIRDDTEFSSFAQPLLELSGEYRLDECEACILKQLRLLAAPD